MLREGTPRTKKKRNQKGKVPLPCYSLPRSRLAAITPHCRRFLPQDATSAFSPPLLPLLCLWVNAKWSGIWGTEALQHIRDDFKVVYNRSDICDSLSICRKMSSFMMSLISHRRESMLITMTTECPELKRECLSLQIRF